jgi:protein-tyrosine phosphatase
MPERHLILEGGFNIRDLGDYSTEDGRLTQWKTLVRAGNLDQLSATGQQQLLDYGVKTIIDLRDEWEVESYPNPFAQNPAVRYMNLPLIGDAIAESDAWKAEKGNYSETHELYARYLAHCQVQIGTIIKAIAESSSTTVIHCHAGKDRTGIVAALVLAAVGVPSVVIAADYALSETQIEHLREQWRAYAIERGQDMDRFERIHSAKPHTMLTMLSILKERYGSITSYLAMCGVSQSQLDQLRERLVR